MDYGKLINRSVNIVWQNKYLIVLGILVSLGSGSFGGGGGGGGGSNGNGFGEPGQLPDIDAEIAALAAGAIIAVICVVAVIALVFWAIATIARGGLIAGVDTVESGEKSGFRQAWGAGWQRVWTLLGIGILPAIPGLILFVLALLALGAYGGVYALFGADFGSLFGGSALGGIIVLVACVVVPIALILSILRNFAERACMLEGYGVIDSYRRGTSVLMSNIGEAIILFVLQLLIFIGLFILLFVPGFLIALCCFLWPLLLVVQGAISAFVSALWTLAWRTWTGGPELAEKEPAAV